MARRGASNDSYFIKIRLIYVDVSDWHTPPWKASEDLPPPTLLARNKQNLSPPARNWSRLVPLTCWMVMGRREGRGVLINKGRLLNVGMDYQGTDTVTQFTQYPEMTFTTDKFYKRNMQKLGLMYTG